MFSTLKNSPLLFKNLKIPTLYLLCLNIYSTHILGIVKIFYWFCHLGWLMHCMDSTETYIRVHQLYELLHARPGHLNIYKIPSKLLCKIFNTIYRTGIVQTDFICDEQCRFVHPSSIFLFLFNPIGVISNQESLFTKETIEYRAFQNK